MASIRAEKVILKEWLTVSTGIDEGEGIYFFLLGGGALFEEMRHNYTDLLAALHRHLLKRLILLTFNFGVVVFPSFPECSI